MTKQKVEKIAVLVATHSAVGIFALWFPESYQHFVNLAFAGFVIATIASIAD